MIGCTDYNKHFHPYGVLLTKTETEDDFAFAFKSIKECVAQLHSTDYNPSILVADSASAITNGFKKVFDLSKRVFCWFHVKKAFDKELNKISDKNIKNQITNDIIQFQHHVQEQSFVQVARLMILKWQSKYKDNTYVADFITYFMKQWLSPKRCSWYDHYVDHVPITNNALEATNRYIKDQGKVSALFFIYLLINV